VAVAQASERIAQRIVDAFKARELPKGDPIFLSHSSEVDTQTVERLARQSNWTDFPQDVLRANSMVLAFMTPEAFAWFLPACMVVSVTQYDENRTLTSTIITVLTPPNKADSLEFETLEEDLRALDPDVLLEEPRPGSLHADDELFEHFMKRFAGLSADEKAAIRDYLEYIDAAHGDDFPVFGPKQALDRYWAGGARSTGEES
jgi:hypothetical protein